MYKKLNKRMFCYKNQNLNVLQGQHLPSLSLNYVTINKDLDKLPPQWY